MYKYTLLTFLTLLYLSCSLFNPQPDCYQDYKFGLPCSFYPNLDTFRIGDTFWFECQVPRLIFDSLSDQEHSMGDLEQQLFYALDIKDNSAQQLSGSDNFDYFSVTGNAQRGTIGGGKEFKLTFKKTPGAADSLKIGFVPRVKGLYRGSLAYDAREYTFEKGIVQPPCVEQVFLYPVLTILKIKRFAKVRSSF
jgi:hypothetical protein